MSFRKPNGPLDGLVGLGRGGGTGLEVGLGEGGCGLGVLGLGAGRLVDVVAGLGGPVGPTVEGLSVKVMITVGLPVVLLVVVVVLLVVVVVGLAVVVVVGLGAGGAGEGGAGGNTGEGGGEGGPANTRKPSSSYSSSSSWATTAEIWGMEAPPSAGGTGIRSETPKLSRTGSEFLKTQHYNEDCIRDIYSRLSEAIMTTS